ncbi:DUF2800 domain-containing protein [Streptococcus danieliae]|nr:DUF2800 domain-containing protein [Streptococcus danieliae]
MPVETHAFLSASSSKRWLNCPMLPRLEASYQSRDTTFTREGTEAHRLSEIKLMEQTGKLSKKEAAKEVTGFIESAEFYNEEMNEMTDLYVSLVLERFNSYDDASIELEQRVDFSDWVPGGFGTSDVVILSDEVLEIIDLKYGKGVPVSAENNPQLMLYALGAYSHFDFLFDFERIKMTIVQPRLDNVSTFEIFTEELIYWAENYVCPRAAQADVGIGNWHIDEEILRWSPVAGKLVSWANKNLEFIDTYDIEDEELLSGDDVASILARANEIRKWLDVVEASALKDALAGSPPPGYKLVEGRSLRRFVDKDAVAEALTDAGFEDIYKPQELQSLGALEKLVGKSAFNSLVGDFIEKPQGKPTLAPISDKRPEFNDTSDDFD